MTAPARCVIGRSLTPRCADLHSAAPRRFKKTYPFPSATFYGPRSVPAGLPERSFLHARRQPQDQLKAYLEKVVRPIEIHASINDTPKSAEMSSLLAEIAALSDKITVVEHAARARRPSR